jgi:hypothetical protein
MDGAHRIAYILGWRHLSFAASVTVLDGTVSGIAYGIEPDVFVGSPISYLVIAHSAHGFWMPRRFPLPVSSADDESPYYRFGAVAGQFSWFDGDDTAIGAAYTLDAPREKVSHVYQADLSCFWNFRGCNSVQQVVPLLRKDMHEILEATAARLTSNNPCPERVLAGRVRALPDLNIALLEAVRARNVGHNTGGDLSSEIAVDYRLEETILGHPEGPWTDMRIGPDVPWPLSPTRQITNPALRVFPRIGERFLYFSGAKLDSCRVVPATPSAEAAVREAVPADRRSEDQVVLGGRM